MGRKVTAIALTSFFAVNAMGQSLTASKGTLREICSRKSIFWDRSDKDAGDQLLQLKKTYQKFPEIIDEVNRALKLTHPGSLWVSDLKLNGNEPLKAVLKNLETLIALNPQKSLANESSPVAKKLQTLFSRFNDKNKRIENPMGYFSLLKEALSTTEVGRKVVSCFEKEHPPSTNIAGNQVLILQEAAPTRPWLKSGNGLALGGFFLEPSKGGSKNLLKTIFFDPSQEPLSALSIVGHEMQHSCASEEAAKIEARRRSQENAVINGPPKLGEPFKAESDQFWLIDDMKALAAEVNLHKELADSLPLIFCSPTPKSVQDLTLVPNVWESMAFEDRMISGELAAIFANYQAKLDFYSPSSVFQFAAGKPVRGKTGFKLKADLKKRAEQVFMEMGLLPQMTVPQDETQPKSPSGSIF